MNNQPYPASKSITALINAQVGKRIRRLRMSKDLTQDELGEQIELSGQQVGKMELGQVNFSASRLFSIAGIFGVGISWFFEDMKFGENSFTLMPDPANDLDRVTIEMARQFIRLPHDVQQALLRAAKTVNAAINSESTVRRIREKGKVKLVSAAGLTPPAPGAVCFGDPKR